MPKAGRRRTLVKIHRKERTSDGQGGWTLSDTVLPRLRCTIQPASSVDVLRGGGTEAQITHVARFGPGVDVRRDDELEDVRGRRYTVRAVERTTTRQTKTRVREIQRGQ